jgi:hypothetical protein
LKELFTKKKKLGVGCQALVNLNYLVVMGEGDEIPQLGSFAAESSDPSNE